MVNIRVEIYVVLKVIMISLKHANIYSGLSPDNYISLVFKLRSTLKATCITSKLVCHASYTQPPVNEPGISI